MSEAAWIVLPGVIAVLALLVAAIALPLGFILVSIRRRRRARVETASYSAERDLSDSESS